MKSMGFLVMVMGCATETWVDEDVSSSAMQVEDKSDDDVCSSTPLEDCEADGCQLIVGRRVLPGGRLGPPEPLACQTPTGCGDLPTVAANPFIDVYPPECYWFPDTCIPPDWSTELCKQF